MCKGFLKIAFLAFLLAITSACGNVQNSGSPDIERPELSLSQNGSNYFNLNELNAAQVSFLKSLPSFTKSSEMVIVGWVSKIDSFVVKNDEGDQFVLSDVTLDVERSVKGEVGRSIVIRVPGGVMNGLRFTYSFAPKFSKDERLLIFLKREQGIIYPYLMKHGKFTINEDDTIADYKLPLEGVVENISSGVEGGTM